MIASVNSLLFSIRGESDTGEVRRSRDEGVGSVVVSIIAQAFKRLCVFGCSLEQDLWRCVVSILDSMLAIVEAPASSVSIYLSLTTIGLPVVC